MAGQITSKKTVWANNRLQAIKRTCGIFAGSASLGPCERGRVIPINKVSVHRLMNVQGNYIWTKNHKERHRLLETGLWTDQGRKFKMATHNAPNTVAIYRIYDSNEDTYYLTKKDQQYKKRIDNGWQDDGVIFYALKAPGRNVHQLYDEPNRKYFWTLKNQHYRKLLDNGWVDQGVFFWDFP